MIESFKYKGMWWLPSNPDNKVPGIIKFDPSSGGELDLFESFKGIEEMMTLTHHEIISGQTLKGEDITLYKCYEIGTTVSAYMSSVFHVNYIFVGVCFEVVEDIKFNKLGVNYSHLNSWVNISGLTKFKNENEIIIHYQKVNPIKAKLNDYYELEISFEYRPYSRMISVGRDVGINEEVILIIETSCDRSILEFLEILHCFCNFLSFATNDIAYPLYISGKTIENKKLINNNEYFPPVKIFYKMKNTPKNIELSSSSRMLFSLKQIMNNYSAIISEWFRKAEELKPVYDLYFEVLYSPAMNIETQFLHLVRAIESYYRIAYKKEYPSLKSKITNIFNIYGPLIKKYTETLNSIININK